MKAKSGFTMIELIVTVAIAAIVLAIGIPSFSSLLKGNRTTTQTNLFVSSVNLARSEAVKRGIQVTLCASMDASSCTESTDWSAGWILLDNTGILLQSWSELHDQLTFTGSADGIQYLNSGFLAGSSMSFLLAEASCAGTEARQINISRIGHARVVNAPCPEAV